MTERVQTGEMRNTTTVFTQSPEETHSFGVELARDLEPQTVIALIGDLGSGKTCLTQGICAGLEVEEYVTSPTFTLINEYRGRLPVYHFDLYRIDDLKEMLDLGYEEYFYGNGVCVIEWAEKMETLLPEKRIEILLKRIGENEREFRITHFTEHTRE